MTAATSPLVRRSIVALVLVGALLVHTVSGAAAAAPVTDDAAVLAEQLMGRHTAAPQVAPMALQEAVPAEPAVFAIAGDEPLVLPGDVLAVGFHESGDERTVPMEPAGRLDVDLSADRVTAPVAGVDSDAEFMVLPTRNRIGGPTSAVDISMVRGEEVRSPVDGTVSTVSEYALYGRTPDVIVEIVPTGSPDLRIRMMHVDGVQVAVGDRVTAGETLIADSARQLPFLSQIDRYAGDHPHVHIDVQVDA